MATGGSDDKASSEKERPGLGMRFVMSCMGATFSAVKTVDTAELAKWIESEDTDVVLLDCREPREYEVSHVPHAIRVDWKTADIATLMQSVAERDGPEKKTIVCYCALGFRGNSMAQKIQQFLKSKETSANIVVYSLEGAIFKWTNEGRQLVDSDGQKTIFAHPHLSMAGILLKKELRKW